MLDDQGHSLAIRVKWELFKNLVLFHLVGVFIHDLHKLLGALLEDKAVLFGALNESKLIGTRCLVGRFASFRININDDCVADGEEAEKVVQMHAFLSVGSKLAVRHGSPGLEELNDGGSDDLDGALDHSHVLSHTIVDIFIGQVAVALGSHLTFLELHLVLSECASFVTEYEFDLAKLLD